MKIALGADHGGFELKEAVKNYLERKDRYEVTDMGNYELDLMDDFPDFAHPVASAVNDGEYERGILFCTTGIGMCMVASAYPNVFAAECSTLDDVKHARKHQGINVMAIGSGNVTTEYALDMVDIFLTIEPRGGKYAGRRAKIKPNL